MYAQDGTAYTEAGITAQIGDKPASQDAVDVDADTDTPSLACFTGDGTADGTLRDIIAAPVTEDEFPSFRVTRGGDKDCMVGTDGTPDTYYIGCGNP